MDSLKAVAEQDRYPGLRSFSASEQPLFFGRRKEVEDLVDLVRAEQITVLFAKSGLGKSSLLNAGLTPKLEALHYRVIPVRFQNQETKTDDPDSAQPLSDNGLLHILLTQLRGEFQLAWQGQTPPPTTSPFYNSRPRLLWEEVKTHPFPNGAVPVFTFDQFEELFIYDQAQRDAFMRQLAELMNDQSPARIMKWLLRTDVDDRTLEMMDWSKQPLVKCLFSIRADRLFEMHKLRAMIPMILRNRYELLPLEDDRAREAIDKPAQAEGAFTTPRFTYQEATREIIIRVLSARKNTTGPSLTDYDTSTCEIESSQLQIVCHYIEDKIKEKVALGGDPVVGPDIIQDDESINRILEEFYHTQLNQIGSPSEIDRVQHVLENDLIVDGHRVGLAAAKMRKSLGDGETADRLIDKLIEVRLIRADDTHLGRTYELSHDTLIEPIEKEKHWQEKIDQARQLREQQRKLDRERRKKNQLFAAVIIAVISTVTALYMWANGRISLANANNLWAEDEYKNGNQRLAYRLWESSNNLVNWIPCIPGLLNCTQSSLDEKDTLKNMFAPFAGASTQFSTDSRNNRDYVASLFQDNSFEVWTLSADETTYEKIDSLFSAQDKPQTNAMASTQLQLRNNFLVVFKHDSLLQVFDLAKKKKIFPTRQDYYSLLNSNILFKDDQARAQQNGLIYTAKTVLLPPAGNWLATLDYQKQAHLFDLKQNCQTHLSFDSLTATIRGFTLDNLTFSADETFLLLNDPHRNHYDLLNLRTNQAPIRYIYTSHARFSPSGNYLITVSKAGQVAIQDVRTGRRIAAALLPDPAEQIADMLFTRNESMVVVVSRSDDQQLTIFGLDLRQPNPALKLIAQHCSEYYTFRSIGHVLYTTGDSTHNYNMATGTRQPLPFRLDAQSMVRSGVSSLLYKPSVPASKDLYLYNVVSGQQSNIASVLTDKNTGFAFYAPAGKRDEQLIRATPRQLTFFTLNGHRLLDADRPASLPVYGTTSLLPATLLLAEGLISVKNQDDVSLYFFVDNQKNKQPFVVDHVYPKLSEGDRQAAGLPN